MKELFSLFAAFARIGAVTIGGGYAMLPMLEREIVERRGWATKEEIIDYFAVGQCTPGVIAVNTATFVGYKNKKIPGGIFATAGVITPSILFILILAVLLGNFMDNPYVQHAFRGINVAVAALVVNAVWKMAKSGVKDWFTAVLALGCAALILFTDISTVFVVVGAGVLALIYTFCKARLVRKGGCKK